MDLTHFALGVLVGIVAVLAIMGVVVAIRGFADLRQRSEKDEAIDAATFLALRLLEDYVRSTRPPSGKPG